MGPGPDGDFPEERQYRLSHANAPSAEKAASYQNSANVLAFWKNRQRSATPEMTSAESAPLARANSAEPYGYNAIRRERASA
ncbi:hypothetical protein K788_0000309 [Paraburkholderia caribensis MBA4]|uniref:Uncharacterized protein n=1 Tax=Paraburkholderia caribensis MBA4 TaxID=1323664 RepID=A0A0P0RJ33_9BURK|nr:hypothetical protein K788_0000309 [Paraburkholderia caribensis MBA4]